MAKKPIIQDGQYLLDLAEVRERMAALGRAIAVLDDLRQQEQAQRILLRDIRRRIKEKSWDIRNLTFQVKRDAAAVVAEETRPDGGPTP